MAPQRLYPSPYNRVQNRRAPLLGETRPTADDKRTNTGMMDFFRTALTKCKQCAPFDQCSNRGPTALHKFVFSRRARDDNIDSRFVCTNEYSVTASARRLSLSCCFLGHPPLIVDLRCVLYLFSSSEHFVDHCLGACTPSAKLISNSSARVHAIRILFSCTNLSNASTLMRRISQACREPRTLPPSSPVSSLPTTMRMYEF